MKKISIKYNPDRAFKIAKISYNTQLFCIESKQLQRLIKEFKQWLKDQNVELPQISVTMSHGFIELFTYTKITPDLAKKGHADYTLRPLPSF